jgi:hypothetical protein
MAAGVFPAPCIFYLHVNRQWLILIPVPEVIGNGGDQYNYIVIEGNIGPEKPPWLQ